MKILKNSTYNELVKNLEASQAINREMSKKYKFINSENEKLHKKVESFSIMESEAVKAEQVRYAELLFKVEELKAKAAKWDALKAKEAKKARDRRAKRKADIIITMPEALEKFLKNEGVYDAFIKNAKKYYGKTTHILTLSVAFDWAESKEGWNFWAKLSRKFNEKRM